MLKHKAPIYKLSRGKVPKHSKFTVTDIRENQWTFFYGADFSSRNNFSNLGSFAKVFVPVKSIIPCINKHISIHYWCTCVFFLYGRIQ